MGFKENLKMLRKEKKLSQKELGEKIGKKEITIRSYENGKIYPPVKVIKDLSKALDVTPSMLMEFDNYLKEATKNAIDFYNDNINNNDFMKDARNDILKKLFKNEDFEKNINNFLFLIKYDLLDNKNNLFFNDRLEIFNHLKKYYEFLINDYLKKIKK